MATPVLGMIDEFDRHKKEWPQYVERLGFFFTANGITADKKHAVFLSVVGVATYKVLRNLISPELPSEKSYNDLVGVLEQHYNSRTALQLWNSITTLEQHYNPAPTEIVEWFKFYSCSRKPGESVTNFLAQLMLLATRCNYGDSLDWRQPTGTSSCLKVVTSSHIKCETHLQEGSQVHHVAPSKGGSALVCYRCGIAGHTRILYAMAVGGQDTFREPCKCTNPSRKGVGARKRSSHPRRPVRYIEEGANEVEVQEHLVSYQVKYELTTN